MVQKESYYKHIIDMIKGSTFEDRELINKILTEDHYSKKSLYSKIKDAANDERGEFPADNNRAYLIFLNAVFEYITSLQTSYAGKRRIHRRMFAWCEHMGEQYHIDDYKEKCRFELPEMIATDIAVDIVKELHNREGVDKGGLSKRYVVPEKKIQVLLSRISDKHCKNPVRIGGQAVFVPIDYVDNNRKGQRRKYHTKNTMSPLVFQMNIMQVQTLMKSFQLNYDSGNAIPLDLAVETWSQLSEYAQQRIKDIFAERDDALAEFIEEVEVNMNSDDFRFMTESEMLENGDVVSSEQLDLAYKGSIVCDLTLISPFRTRKNQRIFYDRDRNSFYAVPADNFNDDRLYFTANEVRSIEEI